MGSLSFPAVSAPAIKIKRARDFTYGSIEASTPVEYDGPYGILLGERYSVIQSVATDGANSGVVVVVENRG